MFVSWLLSAAKMSGKSSLWLVNSKRTTNLCYILYACNSNNGNSCYCFVYCVLIGLCSVRTLQHPEYVGLIGLMVGIGEISGGAIFGIFGKRTRRFGRDPIVVLGMLLHMVSFLLIFYTVPSDATLVLHPEDHSILIQAAE